MPALHTHSDSVLLDYHETYLERLESPSQDLADHPTTKDSPLTDIGTSPPPFDLAPLNDKRSDESSELSDLGDDQSEAETDKMDFLNDDSSSGPGEKLSDLGRLSELTTQLSRLQELESDDSDEEFVRRIRHPSSRNSDTSVSPDLSSATSMSKDVINENPGENTHEFGIAGSIKRIREPESNGPQMEQGETPDGNSSHSNFSLTSVKRQKFTDLPPDESAMDGPLDEDRVKDENMSNAIMISSKQLLQAVPSLTENEEIIHEVAKSKQETLNEESVDDVVDEEVDDVADGEVDEEVDEEVDDGAKGDDEDNTSEVDDATHCETNFTNGLSDEGKKAELPEDSTKNGADNTDILEHDNKPEAKDTGEQSDLDLDDQRKEAIQELISIENDFLFLRDKLYKDKLNQLEHELELCLEGSHPELLQIYYKVNEFYQDNIRLAEATLNYSLKCINNETIATRTSIHQNFMKNLADSRNDIITETTSLWYKINKEWNYLDLAVSDYSYSALPSLLPEAYTMPMVAGGSSIEYYQEAATSNKKSTKQNTLVELVQRRNCYNAQLGVLDGLKEFHGIAAAVSNSILEDDTLPVEELLLRKATPEEINEDLQAMGIQ